jgi:hypothetical protein
MVENMTTRIASRLHGLGNIVAFLAMPGGEFNLGIDAHPPPRTPIKPLDELQFLLEGIDPKLPHPARKTTRVDRLTRLGIEAFDHPELPQFSQGEVKGVETPIGALSARKADRHIGGTVESHVMLHDRHAILRQHDVLFEVVGTLGVSKGLGGQRVFGQVTTGAAVGDDERRRFGREERAEGAAG